MSHTDSKQANKSIFDQNNRSRRNWFARYGWFLLGVLCICIAFAVGFVGMLVGIDESYAARSIYKVAYLFFLAAILSFAAGTARIFLRNAAGSRRRILHKALRLIVALLVTIIVVYLFLVARDSDQMSVGEALESNLARLQHQEKQQTETDPQN